MANFAIITGNIVSNIIVADTKEIAEQITGANCIEYTGENPVGIGYVYDPVEDVFTYPAVSE
jgi:hypothetical protein